MDTGMLFTDYEHNVIAIIFHCEQFPDNIARKEQLKKWSYFKLIQLFQRNRDGLLYT